MLQRNFGREEARREGLDGGQAALSIRAGEMPEGPVLARQQLQEQIPDGRLRPLIRGGHRSFSAYEERRTLLFFTHNLVFLHPTDKATHSLFIESQRNRP